MTPLPASLRAALAASLLFSAAAAATPTPPAKDDFSPYVKLAPFVVNGKQLSVSIHARSGRDRSYAQGFAEEVLKIFGDAVTPDTGKGLVIIGAKGEPHPLVFFQQFLALAAAGKLDPAVAARAPELTAMIGRWREQVDEDQKADGKSGDKDDLEFEQIATALPLPLAGIGAQLYQLAWAEKFNDAKVEARLRALRAGDLERTLFTRFDWVFYLPPKNAFDQVLDDLVARELKEDGAGFFERMAAKGVMLAVKPKIRRAIEAVRKGLLFHTVVLARGHLDESEVSTLTGAYISVLFPDEDAPAQHGGGTEHERAVRAVRAELKQFDQQPAAPAAPAQPAPAVPAQ